jgi:hypothetical protein
MILVVLHQCYSFHYGIQLKSNVQITKFLMSKLVVFWLKANRPASKVVGEFSLMEELTVFSTP